MSSHYYCFFYQQQILIHKSRSTILFESSDFKTDNLITYPWQEVKSFRNGTQNIHYYIIKDLDANSDPTTALITTAETPAATWLPLEQMSSLTKDDLVALAFICEAEILNPDSDTFWIELGKKLFNASGQYWSPIHLNYCLKKRNQKEQIAQVSTSKIQNIIILALCLGFGLNSLIVGKTNGTNSLAFILLCLGAITYTSKPCTTKLSWLLLSLTSLIGIQFTIYNNPIVNFLNALAIIPLLSLYAISLKMGKDFTFSHLTLLKSSKHIFSESVQNIKVIKPVLNRYSNHLRVPGRHQPRKEVLLGIGLSVPILIICGALLASSDPMFNQLIANNFNFIIVWLSQLISFRGILVVVMTLYSFGYLWQNMSNEPISHDHKNFSPNWSPLIIVTLLISINLMYLVFTGIQISYLYIRFAELPEGLTYADYARQGFFQLFFVALINISLSSLFMIKIKPTQTLINKIFKALNGLTCLLTLNLLVSSFYKIYLYEQAFGYTHLRLWVQCFTIALAACLIMLLWSIWHSYDRLLHRCLLVLMLTYSVLGFAVNDSRIAKLNLQHYEETKRIDTEYLIYLSVDAGKPIYQADSSDPVIKNLQKRFAANHIGKNYKNMHWYEWNYNRYQFDRLPLPDLY